MKAKGFTLIELMIVVAIVGILAAIAYPAYQQYVIDARRADGHSALLALQMAMEKYRGSCPTYAANIGSADNCGTSTVNGFAVSRDQHYNLAISGNTGNAYTLTATPQGVQAGDTTCATITLAVSAGNPRGLKGPSNGCW